MIRLEHVTKLYGDVVAVNDFSLEVEKGEVCVLIGPSGLRQDHDPAHD